MRVISKFLTADVRLNKMSLATGKLVIEGSIKEMMPMTVELGFDDVRESVRLGRGMLAELLVPRLPRKLQTLVRRLA